MWNAFTHFRIGLTTGLIMIMGMGSPTWAVPLTFSYEGSVNKIKGKAKNRSPFKSLKGELFQLTYTFESTTYDILPTSPTAGIYSGAIIAYSVTLGSNIYSGNTGTIVIDNQGFAFGNYTALDTFSISGPFQDGFQATSFLALFDDFSHKPFLDDSLPLVQPDPDDFKRSLLQLVFRDPTTQDLITIIARNNVQIDAAGNGGNAVPEPSTLLLLGSGIIALGIWRYGQRSLNL